MSSGSPVNFSKDARNRRNSSLCGSSDWDGGVIAGDNINSTGPISKAKRLGFPKICADLPNLRGDGNTVIL